MARLLRTLGAAALLGGCAIGPTHRPFAGPLPPAFRSVDDSLVIAGPETSPAGLAEVTGDTVLAQLLARGAAANLDVVAAAARVRAARAARTTSALDLAPTVTASAGYTRRRVASATFGGAFTLPDQDVWDVGVEVSWELDLFGRLRRTLQGQGALLAAAREDARAVQVAVAADLADAYFQLRGTQERLAVARENAENQRRTLRLTEELLEGGRGTEFDTQRAAAQLRATLASIPALESAEAATRYRIGLLLGESPAQGRPELEAAGRLPALPATVDVAAPESLVRRRPDVAAAERAVAARTAFLGAAQAEYLPRVSLGGNAGYTALDLDAVGDDGTSRFSLGPVISWPFLNLGRVRAGVQRAGAERDEAQAAYVAAVLNALREAESAVVAYRASRAAVADLEASADASTRAAELARLRFEGGVSDFLQVLDAERTLLDAQDRAVSGRIEAARALVALYRALGGTWMPPAGASR